jgi:hypothetical protein
MPYGKEFAPMTPQNRGCHSTGAPGRKVEGGNWGGIACYGLRKLTRFPLLYGPAHICRFRIRALLSLNLRVGDDRTSAIADRA